MRLRLLLKTASKHNQKGHFLCIKFIKSEKVPMTCMLKAFWKWLANEHNVYMFPESDKQGHMWLHC